MGLDVPGPMRCLCLEIVGATGATTWLPTRVGAGASGPRSWRRRGAPLGSGRERVGDRAPARYCAEPAVSVAVSNFAQMVRGRCRTRPSSSDRSHRLCQWPCRAPTVNIRRQPQLGTWSRSRWRGLRVRVDVRSMRRRCGACSMPWRTMIPVPAGVRVWLATGHTDMRKGFDGLGAAGAGDAEARSARRASVRLPRQARRSRQGALARRPGPVPVRQAAGARALHLADDRRRAVTITPAQLGYLLEGIDWRVPQQTWRPELAG